MCGKIIFEGIVNKLVEDSKCYTILLLVCEK